MIAVSFLYQPSAMRWLLQQHLLLELLLIAATVLLCFLLNPARFTTAIYFSIEPLVLVVAPAYPTVPTATRAVADYATPIFPAFLSTKEERMT